MKEASEELKKAIAENLELRERLEKLEKEIKIEASLEKVRACALTMITPGDMMEVCETIAAQLAVLGFTGIRNVQTAIFNKDKGIYINYEYYVRHHKKLTTEVDYLNHPIQKNFANHMLAGAGQFFTQQLFGKEVQDWYEFQKTTNQFADNNLETADSLCYYWFSIGPVALGLSAYRLLDQHEIDLFRRFLNVFELSYKRFLDIQKAEQRLAELKSTQAQLIQSEKMASLGELTAGIAHEIQNPLNFVNNFSEVNVELSEEIMEALEKGDMEEAKILAADIKINQEKIREHGMRADGIVKSMLQHSRSSVGEKEPLDLNSLADEYLRLSYHGIRARDKDFNADFELLTDPGLPKVKAIPQDMGRVLLNLINNAFYAVRERKKKQPQYQPKVIVKTQGENGTVKVIISDNGLGIPESFKEKIFQPFFTTKPTGEGTGLGLSLSYDIITKGHGGTITFNTREGEGTDFIIEIPVD